MSADEVLSSSPCQKLTDDKTDENQFDASSNILNATSSSLIILEDTIPVIDIHDSSQSSQEIIPDLSHENMSVQESGLITPELSITDSNLQTNAAENGPNIQDELKNNIDGTIVLPTSNTDRLSTASDIQITGVYQVSAGDTTPNKENGEEEPVQTNGDQKQEQIENPTDSAGSLKTFEGVRDIALMNENHIFLEPQLPSNSSKEEAATSSTDSVNSSNDPNTQNNIWLLNKSSSDTDKLTTSTDSPSAFPTKKHLMFNVDVTFTQATKENGVNEIINIICEDYFTAAGSPSSGTRYSEFSGGLADVSRKISPSASSAVPSTQPYQLRTTNRFSQMSRSSSGSSVPSSASALTQKLLRDDKLKKKEPISYTISEDRINELKERWLSHNEIWKVLDFIDKYVNLHDCTSTPDYMRFRFPDQRLENAKTPEKLEQIEEVLTPISTNKPRSVRSKRQAKSKVQGSDSENEIPKKRQRKAADKEYPPLAASIYMPGDSVFAKWSDRKFYAATLQERHPDGKWTVNFYDDDNKVLSEEFILKTDEFTMIGQRVYAAQYDSNFLPGIITGCELKNNELHYIIARDDKGDISVPAKFILITESQARQIKARINVTPRKSARNHEASTSVLNASNRSTRSKTRMLMADSPKPSSSGTQQICSDSEDDGTESTCDGMNDYIPGTEPESRGVYENCIKLKGKSLAGKVRCPRTKAGDVDATVLGLIPEEGSKYFKNMHVLLACTRPQSPKLSGDANTSGSDNSNNENYRFSNTPFVKERLKLQLEMGGATVYDSLDQIPQRMWKNTYLISNRPNTSAKYIKAVSVSIKLVCHDWVIRCCNEKKTLPVQELPCGWSIENNRFYSYFDRKSKWPLKKQTILIVDTTDKNFYKFWSEVCRMAEANVSKLTKDSNLQDVLCVLSECGYRDEVVERVMSHSVPLLTTQWLIQTLVHGEIRDINKNKSYRAECVDSD